MDMTDLARTVGGWEEKALLMAWQVGERRGGGVTARLLPVSQQLGKALLMVWRADKI